ncbi:MAG TPA: hypothetical protein DCM07_18845 [Planctomycetaceae bacterium]|nr:hypothetical protein [Gimesia sp.]HAH46866.1 hypothetical protein [Planctomycetaceae bacterium]HBL42489.1 hypothetical protein [Planctomycetaceae bacterium]
MFYSQLFPMSCTGALTRDNKNKMNSEQIRNRHTSEMRIPVNKMCKPVYALNHRVNLSEIIIFPFVS